MPFYDIYDRQFYKRLFLIFAVSYLNSQFEINTNFFWNKRKFLDDLSLKPKSLYQRRGRSSSVTFSLLIGHNILPLSHKGVAHVQRRFKK